VETGLFRTNKTKTDWESAESWRIKWENKIHFQKFIIDGNLFSRRECVTYCSEAFLGSIRWSSQKHYFSAWQLSKKANWLFSNFRERHSVGKIQDCLLWSLHRSYTCSLSAVLVLLGLEKVWPRVRWKGWWEVWS